MGKQKYGLAPMITVKDVFSGKDLYLTRKEAMRAFERAKKEKQKVAAKFKKLTFTEMSGVNERSLFELQNVLRYERQLRRRRH